MTGADKKNKTGARIAIFFIAVLLPLGFIHCSRNNPLDPNAGNYDPGVNLLIDPGFENQDTAHWRGAISGGRSIANMGAQSGIYSEMMVMDTNGFPRSVWQTVKVSEGKVYSVSGWIKTASIVFSVHIAVFWYNTPDPPASQPPSNYLRADTLGSLSGTTGWTKFSRNYLAPANAQSAQIFLEGVAVKHSSHTGNNGTAWFDNLSFNSH
jgi:hypothetical protein